MKLLAVFGLALAVVAMDKKPLSDDRGVLTHRSQLDRDSLSFNPSNTASSCLKKLSENFGCEICEKVDPEEVFPLVRDCLETGKVRLPKNLFEIKIVRVAAIIFMLRVKGKEGAAECLYNAVMEEHFFEKFNKRLHERSYTLIPLEDFKAIEKPYLPNLQRSTEERDKQFFMLWTVQMFGRRQKDESEDYHQRRLLSDSEEVAWILVRMEFPPKLLLVGLFQLQKELPACADLVSLPGTWLQFLSLTRDDYLGLGEPEKTQLLAFLEEYFRFKWRMHDVLPEEPSDEELKHVQFEAAFMLEACTMLEFDSSSICAVSTNYLTESLTESLTKYLQEFIRIECPIFFLKKKLDFCFRAASFPSEIIPYVRYCILCALGRTFQMVEDVRLKKMLGKEECQHETLVCSQIRCAIEECKKEIDEFSSDKPEIIGPTPA